MASSQSKTISLDELVLNENELAFYQRQTGIQDKNKLKEHIIDIAQKALQVYPYHCIYTFGFLRSARKLDVTILIFLLIILSRFRILRAESGYKQLLKLGSTRPNAFFLDLGCCFGNDLRKAIEDGFPARNVVASDLRADFWNFGHDLFHSNTSTFPVLFIPGNVLDSSFISIQPPLQFEESPSDFSSVSLESLLSINSESQSLNPLRGYLSAIHTSAFFHLFDKDEQILIAKKLASLLSPLPGSVIFGSQRGADEPQEGARNSTGTLYYRHSPETWKEMWEKDVFGGKVDLIRVDAGLSLDEGREIIWWTVTRL
ncbi:hypothetical protein F5890DRAFT_698552 [Lentinula detonsa]|uniref:Methyltransferase domain-containing protein n=1 Tax=Lentinula detonsa TaxID=2804962 RepID=A0AA38UYQ4_9AGAR|nr:hypothetical protein F5890DRAFT_698552 [Lentinula detonsa]